MNFSFKTALNSDTVSKPWTEAQQWCNFVLFKPTRLPEGLVETSSRLRPESPVEESSHRAEFSNGHRTLSIKQFLYDWAPPAYDHPCLWRNAKISTPENTPLPRAHLIGNNYLWFGLDYRRKPAATVNMLRTQIEITTLNGVFKDHEIIDIVGSMVAVDSQAKKLILATSFAELMFCARHQVPASDVPTSYFKHLRSKAFRCYPYAAGSPTMDANSLPGNYLIHAAIKDYRLDSLFLFGSDPEHIQEVEYYFESLLEPGSYVRLLVTPSGSEHSIQYPPQLGDQECHNAVHPLPNGEWLHHAWSKTNENGCHSLVFRIKNDTVNCIIKPAPWTTVAWARNICEHLTTAAT